MKVSARFRTLATVAVAVSLAPLLGACASSGAAEPGRPVMFGLPAVVDSVTATPPLDRTHWGIAAYDPVADRMLLRRDFEKHFIPASNTKLVVTTAALALLGPDFRYRTEVRAAGGENGVATALVVVGSGDPSMSFEFDDGPLGAIHALADSIVASGIRRVEGSLIVDASAFDDQRLHPTWEIGDLDWYYAAPVGAFVTDEGTVSAVIEPGTAAGEPATVRLLAPVGMIRVDNQLVTDTAFARYHWQFQRQAEPAGVMFQGVVPLQTKPDTVHIPVFDPTGFAANALLAALRERGVEVTGGVRVIGRNGLLPPTAAEASRVVAARQSPPLSEIVAQILKPSDNWAAEQLLKTLGAQRGAGGTWEAGIDVETEWLTTTVGIDSSAFHLVDGSGLSAQNLLSPEAVLDLLLYARDQSWGGVFKAALAEPGEEGTLENRLTALKGKAFAKTGSITNVNALSGYVTNAQGHEVVFTILTNGSGEPSSDVRPGIDRIVSALAEGGALPRPVSTQRTNSDGF